MTRLRLAFVLTHPIQYYSPWFRWMAEHAEFDLHVCYAITPTPAAQAAGFGSPFEWDIPLLDGYANDVLQPGANISTAVEDGASLDAPGLASALTRVRPDVLVIPGWHAAVYRRALAWGQEHRVPAVYRGDNTLASRRADVPAVLWHLHTRSRLAAFRTWCAVGQRARAYLRHHGADATRVFASPHAVDSRWFAEAAAAHRTPDGRAKARHHWALPQDARVVCFAGKLEDKKRPLDAVDAVARLGPGHHLLMCGDGPLHAAVAARAASLGTAVTITGVLSQRDMARAYAVSDVLILPSDGRETWGLVVNEALACGLPVVVSDAVGCAPDLVIRGHTGEVAPVGNVPRLAHALAQVLERTRTRQGDLASDNEAARGVARDVVARHAFDASTAGVLAAAERALDDSPGRRRSRVIVCAGSFSSVTGVERSTFEVLRALRSRHIGVHVITNDWAQSDAPHLPHPVRALAERLGVSWSVGAYGTRLERRASSVGARIAQLWDIAATSAGLWRDARRLKATAVLVTDHLTLLRNLPATIVMHALGCRIVHKVGNPPDPSPFYTRLWGRVIGPNADLHCANSEFTRRAMAATGIAPERLTTIYHAIPQRTAWAYADLPARVANRVVYVGQLIPEKGVDVLLEAVAMAATRIPDVSLDVVGRLDGWEAPRYAGFRERLLERSQAPDLQGRVRWLGFREDVPRVLASASVHAVPSRPEQLEGFGIVVVEAKQQGVPSVVSPSGALPELIAHERDGWIARDFSAEALAEGLVWVLSDAARRDALAAAARRSAVRYGPVSFTDAWCQAVSP